MNQIRFLISISFLSVFYSIPFSEEITSEQVAIDMGVCNDELTKVSIQLEHYSFLIGLLQSESKNTAIDSFVTIKKRVEDSCISRMERLVEHGTLIQKKVNNLKSTDCSPCLKSTVGRFCKNVLTIHSDIKQSITEIENTMIDKSILLSKTIISSVKLQTDKGSVNGLTPEERKDLRENLEEAQKLHSEKKYKDSMVLVIEVIRKIYGT